MTRLARLVATVGGLGEVLPAPGTTAGSLPAAAAFAALALLAPGALPVAAVAGCVALIPLSVWAGGCEGRRCGITDPGSVVIDEVMGQWVALSVALLGGSPPPLLAVAGCFLLFRLLDVLKPWPIGALERLPGGWGISLDDLAAGLLAGGLVAGLAALV